MERKCILKNCVSSCNNNVELTFHSFPFKDNIRYKQWMRSIPESLIELPLQEYACICSRHFSSDSYRATSIFKNILREGATPTIFYIVASNRDAAEENVVEMERTFVNVGIQVCPKGTWATEREAKLRRKKFILRKRLQRREEAIKLMRNIIELLRPRKCNIKATQLLRVMNDATSALTQ